MKTVKLVILSWLLATIGQANAGKCLSKPVLTPQGQAWATLKAQFIEKNRDRMQFLEKRETGQLKPRLSDKERQELYNLRGDLFELNKALKS